MQFMSNDIVCEKGTGMNKNLFFLRIKESERAVLEYKILSLKPMMCLFYAVGRLLKPSARVHYCLMKMQSCEDVSSYT